MKTLGIIGGGQLGRMMVEAANKLNITTIVLDPTPKSPAGQLTEQLVGGYKNEAQIKKLSKLAKFLTYEIESANAQTLRELQQKGFKVNPAPQSLEVIQDKFLQKHFLMGYGLPVPDFTRVENEKDVYKASEYLGFPLVLKARFHAYDGRGNAVIKSTKDIRPALKKLKGTELYIERFIPFKKELAIQIARDEKGNLSVYPLVETIQKNNICTEVKYPANISSKIEKETIEIAKQTISQLFGAGVFAIEFFLTASDKILINEIAPRVHNSGHWTIEGCESSQFENHVRAVCGMPLSSSMPKVKGAVMVNILGTKNGPANLQGLNKAEKLPNTKVHIYGKYETKVERKMGHITSVGANMGSAYKNAKLARQMITI